MHMAGYLYILVSTKSGRFYVGSTNAPDRRLGQHNANAVKSTRGKGPWKRVALLAFADAALAKAAERHLKRQKSRRSIEAVVAGSYLWPDELTCAD
jgi:putative endonuclease